MRCIKRSNKRYFKRNFIEPLQHSCWYRKLSHFYKFCKNEFPHDLYKLIPVRSSEYSTRSMQNAPFFIARHNLFKEIFPPVSTIQWINLDLNIRNSSSLNIFRNSILKFIKPSANSVFNSQNPKAINFITRPRLALCHLRQPKFSYNFQDLPNPISN